MLLCTYPHQPFDFTVFTVIVIILMSNAQQKATAYRQAVINFFLLLHTQKHGLKATENDRSYFCR